MWFTGLSGAGKTSISRGVQERLLARNGVIVLVAAISPSLVSYKMSLKRESRMLGIDDQRARRKGIEPGSDSGVLEGQRGRAFPGPQPGGGLPVGERDIAPTGLSPPRAHSARPGAALRREDDRAEPRTDRAADHAIPAERRGKSPKRLCGPCWKRCSSSSRSGFGGFIPTTAASSSIAP